jgi:hypothetical protein
MASRNYHNQRPYMVPASVVGIGGVFIPGDNEYDPVNSSDPPPFINIDDSLATPLLTQLVSNGVISSNLAVNPAQVANAQVSSNSSTGINLLWTVPLDATIRTVLIVRKSGSIPTSPTDGTRVASFTGSAIKAGLNMSFSDVPPTAGTTWGYAIFTYSQDGLVNAATANPGNAATGTMLAAPGKVTGLTASMNVVGQINLAWTNPSNPNAAALVRVFRLLGTNEYPAIDDDGVSTNGASLIHDDGSPTQGGSDSYSDTSALDGQLYTFGIFTQGSNGVWNQTGVFTVGLRNDAPGPVTGFAASTTVAGQINLAWNNPGSLDLALVRVFRLLGATVPTIDSTGATTNAATQVFNSAASPGAAQTAVDSSAVTGQTYTYAAFTKDSNGTWNMTGVSASGSRFDAPQQITNLVVTGGSGTLTCTWTNPTYPNLAEVRVIVRADRQPANYDDTVGATAVVNSDDSGPPDFNDTSGAAQTHHQTVTAGTYNVAVFSKGQNGLKQNAVTLHQNYQTGTAT